ncbi:hypothetical protein LC613_28710 [Nostoc sphaeroides CHAB 2801]|uniref:hypothetical protein n=1 Tax=Nostoc sphaeroides TaxID=446679 RepID=UPI000E53F2A9|nr:hypothetical protein [Nostoc sphaeroides]MCC5631702.1 hypothetical protein [Nostoc sphaeroides CHAB 2801]
MALTITWTDLFNNYVRPALNDTTSAIVDGNRANLLAQYIVSDLQAKGLIDIVSTISSGAITSVDADFVDAWNLISLGIRYYYVNDPVTKYDSAAGSSITRNEKLIQKAQSDYFLHLRAYIVIHKLETLSASQFWTQSDVLDVINDSSGTTCCKDSLEDKIALLIQENINKLAQIAREEEKALVLGDQKRISAIELRQLNRTYELEDRAALIEKTATNGAWTSGGQFTVSYLVDYQGELEDTVPLFEYDLENDSFGIPTLINIGTYTGGFVDVKKYKRLDIELVATNNVSFILQELIGIDWEDVGTVTTDNTIVKSYSLVNTNIIKIVVTGLVNGTQVFVRGTLKGY